MRKILTQKYADHVFSWESRTLDPDIAAILTPKQKLAAEHLTREEWQNVRNGQVSAGAESDLHTLRFDLGMSEQQQAQALPILEDYQARMYQLEDVQKGPSPAQPLWPYSKDITGQKLEAMKKILSPEQYEIYKNHEESILEAQRLENLRDQMRAEEPSRRHVAAGIVPAVEPGL